MAVTFVANQTVYHPSRDRRGREIGHLLGGEGDATPAARLCDATLSATLERDAEKRRKKRERKEEEEKGDAPRDAIQISD